MGVCVCERESSVKTHTLTHIQRERRKDTHSLTLSFSWRSWEGIAHLHAAAPMGVCARERERVWEGVSFRRCPNGCVCVWERGCESVLTSLPQWTFVCVREKECVCDCVWVLCKVDRAKIAHFCCALQHTLQHALQLLGIAPKWRFWEGVAHLNFASRCVCVYVCVKVCVKGCVRGCVSLQCCPDGCVCVCECVCVYTAVQKGWRNHVMYECVMPRRNESCHIWKSHVTHEWFTSHMNMNESRHTSRGRHALRSWCCWHCAPKHRW